MKKSYIGTFLFLLLIGGLGSLLSPFIGYRSVGFIFLLGVLIVGSVTSRGPVLLAALLSTLGWNIFFIPPRFTMAISNPEDILLCITYFIVAIITGFLTHRLRDREEKLRLAERLKESEKLHQTILSSISHELRTPLTAIIGSATALSAEGSENTPQFRREIFQELLNATDRLNRIIDNLLDMSRLSSGVMKLRLEWHDIHDLIGVVLRRLERNLEHHKIKVEVADQLPLVEIDFRLLEHVLSNIIMNAALYSPRSSEIKITAVSKFGNVVISVEDQGPGFPIGQTEKIFEKFYRIPGTKTGGTGLGLSIAKSIVELHQGQVTAENRSEGGSQLSIVIPLGNPPPNPAETN